MIGIAVHAEADQLGVNAGAAPPGVFVFFQHQHAGAVAQHEAVTLGVPRAAGRRRVVVARRQRLGRRKATNAGRTGREFRATCNDDVLFATLDGASREADAMRPGGTRRHDGVIRTFETVFDREIAGHHVDDVARHEEGRDSARTAIEKRLIAFLDAGQTTDTGTDDGADALGIGLPSRQFPASSIACMAAANP